MSDTDLIGLVHKHKSDSSDWDTIVFRGWPESINFVSEKWTMSQKALWNRGIRLIQNKLNPQYFTNLKTLENKDGRILQFLLNKHTEIEGVFVFIKT